VTKEGNEGGGQETVKLPKKMEKVELVD